MSDIVQSRARLHDIFTSHAASLQRSAAAMSAATLGFEQRRWSLLPEVEGFSGSPDDVAGLTQVFDRTAIDQNYAEARSDGARPGVVGDGIALLLQSSFVAGRERALRVRNASSVRCAFHAAARRQGHGASAGIYGNGVVRYVQDLLANGATQ